ncbi:hypothetical protein BC831DRAFT_448278 [Entophlyctis helioformis]|nr:hypothetical protein BC831DRAFT_448278 [Entophlyctis helioformis]
MDLSYATTESPKQPALSTLLESRDSPSLSPPHQPNPVVRPVMTGGPISLSAFDGGDSDEGSSSDDD